MEKYGNISLFLAGSFFDKIQKPTKYRRFASAFVVLYGVQKKERYGDKFMPKMVFWENSGRVVHRLSTVKNAAFWGYPQGWKGCFGAADFTSAYTCLWEISKILIMNYFMQKYTKVKFRESFENYKWFCEKDDKMWWNMRWSWCIT